MKKEDIIFFEVIAVVIILVVPSTIYGVRLFFKQSFNRLFVPRLVLLVALVGVYGIIIGRMGLIHLVWVIPPTVIIIFLFVNFLNIKVLKPIEIIQSNLEKLSSGDLAISLNSTPKNDEIGRIQNALVSLSTSLSGRVQLAKSLSIGDFSTEITLAGEQDMLGISLIEMKRNILSLIKNLNEMTDDVIQNGNINRRMDANAFQGSWQTLSIGINNMLATLQEPLIEISRIISHLSGGDFTIRYEKEAKGKLEELTGNLNSAIEIMGLLLESVADNSKTIGEYTTEMFVTGQEMKNSSQEMNSAISEMSNGATTQLEKVEDSSKLIESLKERSQSMAEKSEMINDAAKMGVDQSTVGVEKIKTATASIEEISGLIRKTLLSMKTLQQKSAEIDNVTNVINNITLQTNLLALNAAIEAAHSGEDGRGFGVIAQEIRKLAESAKSSTTDIENAIKEMRRETEVTLALIEQVNESAINSVDYSNQAQDIFLEISVASRQALNQAEDIRTQTKEQMQLILEIVSNSETVVVVAEETSSGTNQLAASANEMSPGMTGFIENFEKLQEMSSDLVNKLSHFRSRRGLDKNPALVEDDRL